MTAGHPSARAIDARALIAVGVTMLLWSSAFVAIRYEQTYFRPGSLALGRLLVGSLALGLLLRSRRGGPSVRSTWPAVAITGVFWFGVYTVTLNWGEHYTDAGTAALVVGVGPILAALLGGWRLKERLSARLLFSLMVSFAGSALVAVATSASGGSGWGVALCLVAAMGYAIGVVAQKTALSAASALQVTFGACTVGTVVCLPFAGQLVEDVRHAPAGALLAVVYLGLLPTTVGFWTWAYALSRSSVGVLGATTYLVPVLTILLSWVLLSQAPAALAYLGGALCLVGIALSRRRPKPGDEPERAENHSHTGFDESSSQASPDSANT